MTDCVGDRVPSEGRGGEALLSLTTTLIDSALVVTASGELDIMTAPALRTAVRAALDHPGTVVVDLSGVTFPHRPMVERSIAWLVAGGNRRRFRGTRPNDLWLYHRVAGLNLRRLHTLGLHRTPGTWAIA